MKCKVLLLIALTWLIIFANPALGCQCDEYGTPVCAAYWGSDAVFVGQLRDITPPDSKFPDRWPMATLHFIVEQPFRGITTTTVEVGTSFGTSCDVKFFKGSRYLVYAYRGSESKQLFTGFCTRTTQLHNAVDDLNYIRSLADQGVAESITGRVGRTFEPFIGVKIEVRNGNKRFETTTNENGDFSVSLAGPGRYTVRVMVPSAVGIHSRRDRIYKSETTDAFTTIEYNVELGKSQCDYRQLDVFPVDVHATAEISGAVLTASGRPVNKGTVYLLEGEDHTNRYKSAEIEANGSFKFEDVAVGEYLLVLNPKNEAPDKDGPPYGRTFYPNATDASGATKIVVTEGARLENLTLRVGPAWKARTVSGKVVWEEGGPITNANISLYDGKRYVRRIEVDKKGRFSFTVYGDFNYFIEAQAWGERRGKSDRVAITEKSTNLTLVLKPGR